MAESSNVFTWSRDGDQLLIDNPTTGHRIAVMTNRITSIELHSHPAYKDRATLRVLTETREFVAASGDYDVVDREYEKLRKSMHFTMLPLPDEE